MVFTIFTPRMMRGNYFYKRLGRRISSERKHREFTQEKMALLTGIDRTYLARIEEGKANPSMKIMYKISKLLKVKICDLLKGV